MPNKYRHPFNPACIALLITGLFCTELSAAEGYDETMNRARQLRLLGKSLTAETLYTAILNVDSTDADASVGRGYCRLGIGRNLHGALRDFERAIAVAPRYVDAYIGKATALKRQGKRDHARATIMSCEHRCKNDTSALRLLAIEAWHMGYFSIARKLDKTAPPLPDRTLITSPTTIHLGSSLSTTAQRSLWVSERASVTRKIRPDAALSLSGGYYRQYDLDDGIIGGAVHFSPHEYVSLSYEGEFGLTTRFTARQKYKPKVTLSLFPQTQFALGADFSRYSDGWVRFARLELEQQLGIFDGGYLCAGGKDNFGETVFSHMLRASLSPADRFRIMLGGAYGHESVEQFGPTFRHDLVQALFLGTTVLFSQKTGLTVSIAGEWRKEEFFRTVFTIVPFFNF